MRNFCLVILPYIILNFLINSYVDAFSPICFIKTNFYLNLSRFVP